MVAVENGYFGPSVTIAGSARPARTSSDAVDGTRRPGDLVLLPGTALNDDALFIDGVALVAGCGRGLAPARVRTGQELVRTLLGGTGTTVPPTPGGLGDVALDAAVAAAGAPAP